MTIRSFILQGELRHIITVNGSTLYSVAIMCASTITDIVHAESISPFGIFIRRFWSYSSKAFLMFVRLLDFYDFYCFNATMGIILLLANIFDTVTHFTKSF